MKRLLPLLLCLLLLSGCACASAEKPTVICSLFPQYDFAREIAGEYANVSQLLPPGLDSHSYEPSMREILKIESADLFLYTGEVMEPWAANLIKGMDALSAVDVSGGIDLAALFEGAEEGEAHEHEHGDHDHGYDAHIWLDPTLAIVMAENVRDALCALMPEHEAEFCARAEALIANLTALDAAFFEMIASSAQKTIFFGGKFAYAHFIRRYGLAYESAYDSCSAEVDPSARAIVRLTQNMLAQGAKVIFVDELSDGRVASAIAEETGAKTLIFHTCHNTTSEDVANGETYLSLMYKNLENLREGLN